MSHRKDLYQAAATLAGGALVVASGTPLAGITAMGVSLAHLIGLARDRNDADLSAAISAARHAAETALRDNRDFTNSDFARAKALIDTAPRSIDPAAFAAAARNGPPEAQITDNLLAAIDFQPDDHAPRRLLDLILGQTVRTICAHPSMQAPIARAFDVQNAQAVAGMETKIDDLRGLLLQHLERTGEAATARDSGITDARIVALAQQVAADVDDPEQAFRELEAAIADAIAYRNAPPLGANADAALAELRTRLEALADAGQLAEAQQEANAALAHWEAEESERQAQAAQAGIAYLNEAIRRDLDMRDAEAAVKKLSRLVDLQTPNETGRLFSLRAAYLFWLQRGQSNGSTISLEVAVGLSEAMLAKSSGADEILLATNDAGNAWFLLGHYSSEVDHFERAVMLYQSVLASLEYKASSQDWAITRNNLAAALCEIGTHKGRSEKIVEALEVYKETLATLDAEQFPEEWSMAQSNRGLALYSLAQIDGKGAHLEMAINALQASQSKRPRSAYPFEWAKTQDAIGYTLTALGREKVCSKILESAVSAHTSALEEIEYDKHPFDWARIKGNRGTAMRILGEMTHNPIMLRSAIADHYEAQSQINRRSTPLFWATNQNSLGSAWKVLGQLEHEVQYLFEAEKAYANALYERRRLSNRVDMAVTHSCLCGLHLAFFDTLKDTDRLSSAQEALDRAGAVFTEFSTSKHLLECSQYQAAIDARRR